MPIRVVGIEFGLGLLLDLLIPGDLVLDLGDRIDGRCLTGLDAGQQRGQRAGERIDLVGGQHRAVDELGLVL